MISKGTTHNDGARLADYMTASKDGERAELWQLRGFEATDIKDAFRDVQIMAGATRAEQPFFHVQVRNREGERLTREQFEVAADRIERMLGLTGQPRAIAFHTYDHNDDMHMHVVWSRIDQDRLTAIPLPFFKDRLKKISRELEWHFGLEPVTNDRKGQIRFAPTKAEHEQARRLGLDIHEVRNTIRELWDRSDSGHSFQAALEHEGFILARGERRDFVVIDQAGGMHALGKRMLDVTASKIRDRLSDIRTDQLPSVEMARALMPEPVPGRDRQQERERERTGAIGKEEVAINWDRDRDDRLWQEAVVNAAIAKDQADRRTEEPKRGAGAGDRKRDWAIPPSAPEPSTASPRSRFQEAATTIVTPIQEAPAERVPRHAERPTAMPLGQRESATSRESIFGKDKIRHTVKIGKAATRTIGKTLDVLSDAFDSLIAPTLSPEQLRDGEKARNTREDEAESTLAYARHNAAKAERQRQWEDQQEAARRRQRDDRDR